jgi:hypothetical protein
MTVASLINDRKTYSDDVIAATKAYARSKPWRGTIEERQAKLQTYHQALCAAYGVTIELEFQAINAVAPIGGLYVTPDRSKIVLQTKISLVNYLHAFTKARGAGKRECFVWSINLFKRYFPKSFDRAEKVGPYLLSRGTQTRLQAAEEAAQDEAENPEIEGWDDSEE